MSHWDVINCRAVGFHSIIPKKLSILLMKSLRYLILNKGFSWFDRTQWNLSLLYETHFADLNLKSRVDLMFSFEPYLFLLSTSFHYQTILMLILNWHVLKEIIDWVYFILFFTVSQNLTLYFQISLWFPWWWVCFSIFLSIFSFIIFSISMVNFPFDDSSIIKHFGLEATNLSKFLNYYNKL